MLPGRREAALCAAAGRRREDLSAALDPCCGPSSRRRGPRCVDANLCGSLSRRVPTVCAERRKRERERGGGGERERAAALLLYHQITFASLRLHDYVHAIFLFFLFSSYNRFWHGAMHHILCYLELNSSRRLRLTKSCLGAGVLQRPFMAGKGTACFCAPRVFFWAGDRMSFDILSKRDNIHRMGQLWVLDFAAPCSANDETPCVLVDRS
ncbi:hypothetical protein VTK73DRAFT_1125 [Phialemonium thermophilum]|uniref:Uncharacterized protein n=1 Tax=Phialemonium thermophilum TaxID=223376 RepID=A0ABR3VTX2_9PEZI